jgi:hypothetical protein
MNVGAKVQKDKAELSAKQSLEGTRIGVDIAKSKEQMALARENRQNTKKEENR